ncbi:MAG: CoA transferase [Pseudomonadaceae bacterium]|nr:CoA transferase [Pseudomonadaceae bacterium]
MVKLPVDGPLNGIKILDLTHVWAGPLAVRFLADLGAEVVKIEAPYGRGSQVFPSQPIGGWLGGEAGEEPWNVNAVFNKLNRNRRSVCLDLKQEQGREILLQLVAVADVIIENFSARAMPAMGLGFEVLKRANPQIIHVCMPGFGASGPYHGRVAFGPIVEPMTGLAKMLGYEEDKPMNTAMALMDPIAATHAASAVVQALRKRQLDGAGGYVELSLYETGVAFNGPWLLDTQLGETPVCQGNAHPQMAPHGVYPCQGEDNWLALACQTEVQWQQLCLLVDGLDNRLTLSRRLQARQSIDETISLWTAPQEKNAACELLQHHGIAAGPVNNAAEMLADEQVQARQFFRAFERFNTPMPGNPIHMPGLDPEQWQPCPDLGADNHSVLEQWLGYADEQVTTLHKQGVVHDKPPT